MTYRKLALLGCALSAVGLSACGSGIKPAVPVEYLQEPTLDRHDIGVRASTEVLEIVLNPNTSQLHGNDKRQIEDFVRAYVDHGHGPLTMLLPEGANNPQLAVDAVAQARQIAFARGVNYEEIDGGSTLADDGPARLFLSFTSYTAVAPDCESFATIDFGNARSNNDLRNLGCSVRTNMAAMIADPADLLGERPLGQADSVRRYTTFELYREGQPTGAERNRGESGAVSTAIAAAR